MHIMSYTYRDTTPIFPRWRLYVVSLTLRPISNKQLYHPISALQPQFSPYNASTPPPPPLPRQSCQTSVFINCITHTKLPFTVSQKGLRQVSLTTDRLGSTHRPASNLLAPPREHPPRPASVPPGPPRYHPPRPRLGSALSPGSILHPQQDRRAAVASTVPNTDMDVDPYI